ncbi:MAG: adenine phosphoribosyltransferase [Candidatus Methylomirabilis sp.]|nr:adenine phosphoribosyltransferase [Deltaproteobacteria bacterium]
MDDIRKAIREIPNFPKEGILFFDITTLLQDPKAFAKACDVLVDRYIGEPVDAIVAIDARGFIFGSVLAYRLNKPLVVVRKKGKLPFKTRSVSYTLEYGVDEIHMNVDGVAAGQRCIVIDDLLATGGTAKAACDLVTQAGGKVHECCFIIEIEGLGGKKKLEPAPVYALLEMKE